MHWDHPWALYGTALYGTALYGTALYGTDQVTSEDAFFQLRLKDVKLGEEGYVLNVSDRVVIEAVSWPWSGFHAFDDWFVYSIQCYSNVYIYIYIHIFTILYINYHKRIAHLKGTFVFQILPAHTEQGLCELEGGYTTYRGAFDFSPASVSCSPRHDRAAAAALSPTQPSLLAKKTLLSRVYAGIFFALILLVWRPSSGC